MIDFNNKVNAITLCFILKLDLLIQKTNVDVSKIDGNSLEIHSMTIARFLLQDVQKTLQFFEITFLLANIIIEVVLKISFLFFCYINVDFADRSTKTLTWKTCIAVKALATTSRVEFKDKREFAKVLLDKNSKTFDKHVAIQKVLAAMIIYFFWAV